MNLTLRKLPLLHTVFLISTALMLLIYGWLCFRFQDTQAIFHNIFIKNHHDISLIFKDSFTLSIFEWYVGEIRDSITSLFGIITIGLIMTMFLIFSGLNIIYKSEHMLFSLIGIVFFSSFTLYGYSSLHDTVITSKMNKLVGTWDNHVSEVFNPKIKSERRYIKDVRSKLIGSYSVLYIKNY